VSPFAAKPVEPAADLVILDRVHNTTRSPGSDIGGEEHLVHAIRLGVEAEVVPLGHWHLAPMARQDNDDLVPLAGRVDEILEGPDDVRVRWTRPAVIRPADQYLNVGPGEAEPIDQLLRPERNVVSRAPQLRQFGEFVMSAADQESELPLRPGRSVCPDPGRGKGRQHKE